MLGYLADYCYILSGDAKIFTVSLLPGEGKWPVILIRTPYVDALQDLDEQEITGRYLGEQRSFLQRGYAVVIQHCRGRGKSEGDCIPYINEREDGLALQEWVRHQPFYNGEIYLKGGSYLTSVHYATAPFAPDIRGAIFGIQDSCRYNICYRNGCFKKGLHGGWYVGMYKAKSRMRKFYTPAAFDTLPLSAFSQAVLGEPAGDLDEMLRHPDPTDAFWSTRWGGAESRGATDDTDFPMLLTTGFFDLYTGGIFDMWNSMTPRTRANSALVVSPYDHGDSYSQSDGMCFPEGKRIQHFGEFYEIDWLDAIRGKGEWPVERGKISYYRLFENRWGCDDFASNACMKLPLGDHEVIYTYNPFDAPGFRGGLSCNFGGTLYQDKPGLRQDIVSIYTEPFAQETFVKGKITARLKVCSDCEDTCFYMRLSIEKEQGDLGLRDDITTLCFRHPDYVPGQPAELDFSFDEIAFLVKKGERLRIDIASADREHYVRHTNQKGLFSQQTTAKIAHNTIFLQDSVLTLPLE